MRTKYDWCRGCGLTKAGCTCPPVRVNDRIHYSGDMANTAGWFVATQVRNDGTVNLEEQGGENRIMCINALQIGNFYRGHCDPRFVTEAAVEKFKCAQQI
jgi:hypothetical protein